jgi:hypothetical protein
MERGKALLWIFVSMTLSNPIVHIVHDEIL